MKTSRWNLAIPMTSSNAFPKRNGCSRKREAWIQDRQRHGNATRRILTGGARQARAHLGLNSRNSCDALSKIGRRLKKIIARISRFAYSGNPFYYRNWQHRGLDGRRQRAT